MLRGAREGDGAECTLRLSNAELGVISTQAPVLGCALAGGTRIARYQVLEVVGSGATGTLYRARDLWKFGISAATDLGHVYVELGRFDEAEATEQRATDDIRRMFGAQHPRMMSAYGNLSTVQAKAGHREQALATIAEYRRLAATMPPSEPRLKYLPLQEARVWRITGDCARAVPFLREALVKFSAADGPDHPLTTQVMNDLGVCLAATAQIPEALSILERAVANYRQSGNVLMFNTGFELAKVLWSLPAQRPRARSLAREALAQWKSDGSAQLASVVEKWLAEHRS